MVTGVHIHNPRFCVCLRACSAYLKMQRLSARVQLNFGTKRLESVCCSLVNHLSNLSTETDASSSSWNRRVQRRGRCPRRDGVVRRRLRGGERHRPVQDRGRSRGRGSQEAAPRPRRLPHGKLPRPAPWAPALPRRRGRPAASPTSAVWPARDPSRPPRPRSSLSAARLLRPARGTV